MCVSDFWFSVGLEGLVSGAWIVCVFVPTFLLHRQCRTCQALKGMQALLTSKLGNPVLGIHNFEGNVSTLTSEMKCQDPGNLMVPLTTRILGQLGFFW